LSANDIRLLLSAGQVTHVPGVYDPVSASLAVRAGHRVVHLSGAAVSALALGRPDLEFGHATQIADRAATLRPALEGVPLLADAHTGFGDPLSAVWTALAYVRAGVSGLQLGDRTVPDRSASGPELVTAEVAAAKVTALVTEVPQLALIARTSAYAVSGLPGAVERCRRYAEAGADAVLAEGVDDPADLARLHDALPGVALVVDRSEATAGRAALPDAELAAAGVRLVLHPMSALLAALRAASVTYRNILADGVAEPVDRLPPAVFTTLATAPAAARSATVAAADPTARLQT
jgi:methylisocitrate lyase